MKTSELEAGWFPAGLQNYVLPKTAGRVMIFDNDIALWRGEDGKIRAWENRCPHRGMRLSYGIVRGNTLTCLYHGWTYDGAGACAGIPAHPELTPPKTIRAKAYRAADSGGFIWVANPDETTEAPSIEGDWVPNRSVHIDLAPTSLNELIKGMDAELALKITDRAAVVRVPGVTGEILLAFLNMKEHGAMIHTSIPASASVDAAIAVSKLTGRLRQIFKASSAA
ncbi:Rieske (2Fe-2S) protein [Paracoccus onubensis]|uniref:Rieske (2Fe-2S) protein n=1 Tax=Paracoccus onubensis TaxID=1675788 RepID=UPI0027311313|nr:Rieske (2Fe-2S) protein [Paracoccus onubensis]MDP0926513.1 Rieske (2Fe-2S) protein [Paracoccus onubensis]